MNLVGLVFFALPVCLLVSREKGHATKVELIFPATSLEPPRERRTRGELMS
jgi:hypothetical protein